MKDSKMSARVFNAFNMILFCTLGIIMLYPIWYVFMYSFSDPNSTPLNSLYLLPNNFTLETYSYVFKQPLIFAGYKNTIFITIVGTAINLFITSCAAYPLSREKMLWKKVIFQFLFFTLLFSGGMIPTYLIVRQTGLVDTLWAMIIPNAISIYYMLIMMRFFKSIPMELIESAKIDGCNDLYILFRIVLPLSTAVLAAIGLFYAVWHWNEYLAGVIYINHDDKYPLQVILYNMLSENILGKTAGFKDSIITPRSMKMSAVVVALVPILMIYPFIQKYFMKGIMLGSVKG